MLITAVSSIYEDGNVEEAKITMKSRSLSPDDQRFVLNFLKNSLHEKMYGGNQVKQGGHLYSQPSKTLFKYSILTTFPDANIISYSDKNLVKGMAKRNNEYFIAAEGPIQIVLTVSDKKYI